VLIASGCVPPRRGRNPIVQITEDMKQLAEGDLGHTKAAFTDRTDEVGEEMARALGKYSGSTQIEVRRLQG